MKPFFKTKFLLACLFLNGILLHAAPFQNLGFDDAVLTNLAFPNIPLGGGKIEEILPGWQLSLGGSPYSFLPVNRVDQGDGPYIPNASLVTADGGGVASFISFPVEGKFGLYLYDVHPNNPVSVRYALSQTGDVPLNAKLLSFTFEGWAFDVSINGVKQNTFPGSIFAPDIAGVPTVRSVDVSQYAGQTVELKFEGQRDIYFSGYSSHFLDSISFEVPEPNTVVLLALGGGALLAAGFRRRRI